MSTVEDRSAVRPTKVSFHWCHVPFCLLAPSLSLKEKKGKKKGSRENR